MVEALLCPLGSPHTSNCENKVNMYGIPESPYCTPETNRMLDGDDNGIKKKKTRSTNDRAEVKAGARCGVRRRSPKEESFWRGLLQSD